jgi:hypothetical protein
LNLRLIKIIPALNLNCRYQYSRVNVMDLEYIPGDSDWKLVAKIFPYNITI